MATGVAVSPARVNEIRALVKSLIDQYFAASLGRENDINNVVNAIIWHESRYYSDEKTIGQLVSTARGSYGYKYLGSSACQKITNIPLIDQTPEIKQQIANIYQGVRAMGLMQVMGWNIVKGATSTGLCEIERIRPDLAGPLLINPGESITDKMIGDDKIRNQILCGLIILEGGYRVVKPSGDGFKVPGDKYNRTFATRMTGTLATYIGLGRADSLGTTPEKYIAAVYGGDAYKAANSGGKIITAARPNVIAATGPSTNSTGSQPIGLAGCG